MIIPKTLNEEVRITCFEQGGYPEKWNRHTSCPCCGTTSGLVPTFSKCGINHSACLICGFVCVDPYPPDAVLKNLYSGSYYTRTRELYELPRLRREGAQTDYTAPRELLEDTVRRCTRGRESAEWLDVGGGIGAFATLVRSSNPGWSIALNEMNSRSAEIAKEIFDINVEQSEPTVMAESNRRFDVISAIAVLEHVVDPLAFIRSYAALLRPGGLLVVVAPHFTPLCANVAKASSPMVAPPFHVSLFNRRNIKTLFERSAMFEDISIDDFGPSAFSLVQHVDYADYWDITIPTEEKPNPAGLMVMPYPPEMATAINELARADVTLGPDFFAETDGRLYLRVIAKRSEVPV